MKLDTAIERFRQHLAHERELSPRTVEAYATDLAQLSRHIAEDTGRAASAGGVGLADIRGFLAGEIERGLGGRSIMRKISAIRALFRYLARKKIVSEDPTIYLAQQIARRSIPSVVSEERIQEMMSIPDTDTLKGLRDRTILEFLYGTGVRLREMIALDVRHFLPLGETVRVLGKGNKERLVPFGGQAREVALRYWAKRFSIDVADDRSLKKFGNMPAFST